MYKRMRRIPVLLLTLLIGCTLCGTHAAAVEDDVGQYGMLPVYGVDIADGAYTVKIESDSSLLRDALADITVSDGAITAELLPSTADLTALSLQSSADAAAETAMSPNADGVFTFSIPALDTAISLSVYQEQENTWQNRTILFRADSLPQEALRVTLPDYDLIERALASYSDQTAEQTQEAAPVEPVSVDLPDGEYSVSVDLTGGSGKASVSTPTLMIVRDGKAYARLVWSSSNYDYMVVGTETYYNTGAQDSNSVFEIPIGCWDSRMPVIADTTAMGTPHEVSYTLTFYQASIGTKGQLPQEAAKRVVFVALGIIVGGGIFNHYVKKKRRV